jgi:2-octaprenyl-6-methoxyphenol hydroxylase
VESIDYDIAICGAGPTGSALALLLARHAPDPARIALIGKQFHATKASSSNCVVPAGDSPASTPMAADPRSLALNQGSRVLLEQLGAWPARFADIRTVHVSQRGHLGRTLIRAEELETPRLGCVVAYDALLGALHAAAAGCGATLIEAPQARPTDGHGAQVDLGDRTLSSRLAVQSDGAQPQGLHREYGQHAVLATVRAGQPRTYWAFERFTAEGPLAVLPHPDGADLYGVVWCCAPSHARRLADLPLAEFEAALYAAFGDRLGHFTLESGRHVFPLSLHAGPSLLGAHSVAIGNAAQTLHPVAGQGLNLGLRDAAQLAQALAPWLARSSADPAPILVAFARTRRADRYLTAGITDLLPRVFASPNPLLRHACGLGLLALDLSLALRAPLARHLMQGLRA